MEENYNTLIKQAVRAVLKPKGMFQKGSSRIWIDDNGWFFTVVEFQGSWCDRGSYLNIGMQHLWNEWEYLFTVCGTREAPLCLELESKVRRALERVPIDWAEEMLTQILSLLDESQKIHADKKLKWGGGNRH